MRKILLIGFLLLLGCNQAFSYEDRRTVESVATTDSSKALFTVMTIANATFDTVSESLVNTGLATNLGVMWQATSPGTPAFTIQAMRSFQRPTNETLTDASYVVWNSSNTVSDTNWHMATLDTIVEPYLRFRITPTAGNNTGTTLQIKVEKL